MGPSSGPRPHKRGLLEAFLKVATIKKTPVLKREELYQGLIEPGWGAGLLESRSGRRAEHSLYDSSYAQEFPIRTECKLLFCTHRFPYERCSHSKRSLPGK